MSDQPQPTPEGGFDYAGWLAEPPSREEFFAFLTSLAMALDDQRVLSFEQLHESFADTVTKRAVNGKQTESQTYSLRMWLMVVRRLADAAKKVPR